MLKTLKTINMNKLNHTKAKEVIVKLDLINSNLESFELLLRLQEKSSKNLNSVNYTHTSKNSMT